MQRACLLLHCTNGTVFLECSGIIRKCNILFSFNFNEMPRPGRRVRRGARQEAARAVSCINKMQNMFTYLWSCCLCSSKHNEFILVSGEFSVLVKFLDTCRSQFSGRDYVWRIIKSSHRVLFPARRTRWDSMWHCVQDMLSKIWGWNVWKVHCAVPAKQLKCASDIQQMKRCGPLDPVLRSAHSIFLWPYIFLLVSSDVGTVWALRTA